MLQLLEYVDHAFRDTSVLENACLVRLVRPDNDALTWAQTQLGIPRDFLAGPLDRDERPRIEVDGDNTLIIIRIPHHDTQVSDVPYVTIAFGIVLTPNRIVTVCSEPSVVMEQIIANHTKICAPTERMKFVCTLMLQVARQYLLHLRHISEEANAAEKVIHLSLKNEMLIRMLNLEKCLVYLTTSLKANEPIWERLHRVFGRSLSEDELDMLEDVKVEFRQAHDLAGIHSSILSGTMGAFASIVSNNLTVVMKTLTSITIVLMIPTLLGSIYGMNVELPLMHSPHAFMLIMALSVTLSAISVYVFLRRNLF
jgi:magnesium transporter